MKHLLIQAGLSSLAIAAFMAPAAHAQHNTSDQAQSIYMNSNYGTPTYSSTSYSPASSYTSSAYTSGTVNCPAGTSYQSDGTCLQTSSSSYETTTYSSSSSLPSLSSAGHSSSTYSSTTYSAPTTSYTNTAYLDAGQSTSVQCPGGSAMQSDGTCLQGGSSSYGSTTTYSSGSSTYSPSTTQTYSSQTYTNQVPSYSTPRSNVPLADTVYCYRGTSKIYDARGVEIGHVCGQRGQSGNTSHDHSSGH